MKNIVKYLLFAVFLVMPIVLRGAEVLVSYPTSGTYTAGSGITNNNYSAPTFSWNITRTGDLFTYIYSFSDTTIRSNGFILQTGASVVASQIIGASHAFTAPATINPAVRTYRQRLPSSVFGIQVTNLNVRNFTFSFTSRQAPIWGNFYVGALVNDPGCPTAGCNYNFNNSLFTTIPTDGRTSYVGWVPVPGSITVPESETWLLLSSFVFIIIVLRKRLIHKIS